MKTVYQIVFLILIIFFGSCSSSYVFNDSTDLPASGWNKNDSVIFETVIEDTVIGYDFTVSIRNSVDYRYSNLYFFMLTEFPNGNHTRDTIEFIIADRQGNWLGKGWGSVKENEITLNKNIRFPLIGKYKFAFQQAMRADTLEGIVSVGLKISETDY
jgi:gliding motility-associated lipoprotein GldH